MYKLDKNFTKKINKKILGEGPWTYCVEQIIEYSYSFINTFNRNENIKKHDYVFTNIDDLLTRLYIDINLLINSNNYIIKWMYNVMTLNSNKYNIYITKNINHVVQIDDYHLLFIHSIHNNMYKQYLYLRRKYNFKLILKNGGTLLLYKDININENLLYKYVDDLKKDFKEENIYNSFKGYTNIYNNELHDNIVDIKKNYIKNVIKINKLQKILYDKDVNYDIDFINSLDINRRKYVLSKIFSDKYINLYKDLLDSFLKTSHDYMYSYLSDFKNCNIFTSYLVKNKKIKFNINYVNKNIILFNSLIYENEYITNLNHEVSKRIRTLILIYHRDFYRYNDNKILNYINKFAIFIQKWFKDILYKPVTGILYKRYKISFENTVSKH